MLAQFMYDIDNYFYEKKISKFFQNFFQFFSVFWTPFMYKKIFLHFWATFFYVLGGQHVHLTPKKCFLDDFSTECP